jgi:MFS family permease
MSITFSPAAQTIAVFRRAFGNPDLRRVELAFAGFNVAEYGTWIAIMVFAYSVGGTTAAGLVGAAQLIPAALVAPLASVFGDRYPRNRVLVTGYLAQAVTMGLTGITMVGHAPVLVTYALAATAATSVTLTRPVQGALLPSLAHTPAELVAANVTSGWVEGASLFAGPLLTGILLAASSIGSVFLIMAAVTLASAILAAGITHPLGASPGAERAGVAALAADLAGGLRVAVAEADPRLVVSLMAANFLLVGAIDILLVMLSIQLLGMGSPGVGYLTAAFGVGGLVGATITTALTSRRSLTPVVVGAGLAWALGLSLVSVLATRSAVPLLIVVAGSGKPLIDVVGRILLQRVVADRLLSRIFGVLEGVSMAAQAAGMALVPVVAALVGPRPTFVAFGLFMPLLVAGVWRGLKRIDAIHSVAEERLPLVRSLAIFAPLSPPTQQRIAAQLEQCNVGAGSVIVREGETGDQFFIVGDGQVSVSIAGQHVRTLRSQDFFGEIALIRGIARTATVIANTDTLLYSLDRADFLEAVTRHAQSLEAVHAVSDARMSGEPDTRPAPRRASS